MGRANKDSRKSDPRGARLLGFVIGMVVLAAAMLGGMAGLALAWQLPSSLGVVRLLIGGVALFGGLILGMAVAAWAVKYGTRVVRRVTRSGEPLATTPERTSPRRARRVRRGFGGLVAAVLTAFGPIVLAVTLIHGIKDEHLVDRLRHHGVRVTGFVQDRVTVSGSSGRGGYSVSHHIELDFMTKDHQSIGTPDPAIGGHRYSKGRISHAAIVYDPADPHVAAVAQQLGSPWRGGRLGNLIAGSALTLALIGYVPFWLRRRRRPAAQPGNRARTSIRE